MVKAKCYTCICRWKVELRRVMRRWPAMGRTRSGRFDASFSYPKMRTCCLCSSLVSLVLGFRTFVLSHLLWYLLSVQFSVQMVESFRRTHRNMLSPPRPGISWDPQDGRGERCMGIPGGCPGFMLPWDVWFEWDLTSFNYDLTKIQ